MANSQEDYTNLDETSKKHVMYTRVPVEHKHLNWSYASNVMNGILEMYKSFVGTTGMFSSMRNATASDFLDNNSKVVKITIEEVEDIRKEFPHAFEKNKKEGMN